MRLLSSTFFVALLFASCSIHPNANTDSNLIITLRWSKAFPDQSQEDVNVGILWALSYLGAALPPGCADQLITWQSERTFSLDLNHAGFPFGAKGPLAQLLRSMKSSEEYLTLRSINAGRFIQMTLNSSWHYYAITSMPPTLVEALDQKTFLPPITFERGQSGVAYGKRLVFLPDSTSHDVQDWVFYANEGFDSAGHFVALEYEVFDFMANGQPRFAVYDRKGLLKKGSDPTLSKAGKPAKCMWCHEGKTLRSFKKDLPNHLQEFNQSVSRYGKTIRNFQESQSTTILHDSVGHHRRAEFLFASIDESHPIFIEEEYGITKDSLARFLIRLESHTSPHFPEFEEFYYRKDLLQLEQYSPVRMPSHMWETSEFEPNLLKEKDGSIDHQ